MSVQHVRKSQPRSASGVARVAVLCLGLVTVASLQGCATAAHPDPMESWNRKVFSFNDALDENLLKPVAIGYRNVTPEPVRTGFTNFVNNIKDIWSTVNLFLQGRFTDGTLSVIRVSINSTFGFAGLLDVATPMQLERPNEDLGQTFGVWGAKPGAYIVWPILGPSTVRDSIALPADSYFSASIVGEAAAQKNLLRLWQGVNLRAGLLDATNLLNDVALDKYAFVRDAYLQRRQNLIYEGDPPAPDEEPYDPYDDEQSESALGASGQDGQAGTPPATPAAPASAASSPDA
jgi:phospholipid-binding lipoprotein MlaA